MNVALIHHQLTRKGGMESYLCDLIDGFITQGDDISTYVYRKDNLLASSQFTVNYSNLKWLPRSYRKFWFAYSLRKKILTQKHDLTLSLMRSLNQDMVICGGTHKGYLQKTKKFAKLRDRIEILFETKSYHSSKIIVAHSNMMAEEIVNLYNVPASKITTIYPPINISKFNLHLKTFKQNFREALGISCNKIILLFSSTDHKRKGFYPLYEAFKQLPANNFELIIAGQKIPSELNLPNVKCLGFVTEMQKLYAAADFLVLPSHYEPFGLVVVEALQCGTPVIISSQVGAKELVTKNEGVIIEQVSADEILSGIHAACQKEFKIPADFAEKNNLTIDKHITKIKDLIVI